MAHRPLDLDRRTNWQKQRVAVLGGKAAEKLFGEIPPGGRRDHHQRAALHGHRRAQDQDADLQLQHAGQRVRLHSLRHRGPVARPASIPTTSSGCPPIRSFATGAVKQVRETLARAAQLLAATTSAPSRSFVFNEFMRIVDTMGIALRAPARLRRHADAGHRRRGAGQHHAGLGDAADARDRRAEIDRRHPPLDPAASSCWKRWRS